MKNVTLIVWVVFAFLLGLIYKAHKIDQQIHQTKHYELRLDREIHNLNKKELMCLAKNVYFEAGGEPIEGKAAVAQVVLNRMHHPAFPKSVCGVVNQKTRVVNKETNVVEKETRVCQFSWVCEEKKKVAMRSQAWYDSMKIAKVALTEHKTYDKFGKNVLFFHEKHLPFDWKHKYKKVETIGNHVFYRT